MSHGSRPLLLAARALRLPVMTLYDYEGASVGLFHRLSDRVLVPAAVFPEVATRSDATRVVKYDGVKEQLYLSDFRPAEGVRTELGAGEEDVVVLLRPEAESAHYHPGQRRSLIEAVLERLASEPSVRVVLLPRDRQQLSRLGSRLGSHGLRFTVPEAVDGRNLIWAADLVISGGGTMTREAAVLGVPAYSIFQGVPGAVDTALEREGRLVLLRDPADVAQVRLIRRSDVDAPSDGTGQLLDFVVSEIVELGRR